MRGFGAVLLAIFFVACGEVSNPTLTAPTAPELHSSSVNVNTDNGFDQYGYNRTARIFNGTGTSWCLQRNAGANCLGAYSPDKLLMKWNSEWDRGNAEGWNDPNGYRAWENNEWNGNCQNCSGAVWHYKIQWVGACSPELSLLPDGGYCIWGQFEVLMDQGHDPNLGPGHIWFAKANPNGYGNFGN